MTVKVRIAGGNIFGGPGHVGGEQSSVADEIRAREKLVDGIAASIYVQLNVANLLVWTNPRTGTQHWREDCPALRRAHLGESRLIPRSQGMEQPCGRCAQVERDERARENNVKITEMLALEPPNFEPLQINP